MGKRICICENAIEKNNQLLFPVFWGNSLYLFDKKSGLSYRKGQLINEERDSYFRLGKAMARVDDTIVVAPYYENMMIAILNISTGESEYIDLSVYLDMSKANNRNCMFSNCFSYGRNVFLSGMSCPYLLQLNIDTRDITVLSESEQVLEDYYLLYGDSKGSMALIPMANEQSLLYLDMKRSSVEKISVTEEKGGFAAAKYDDEDNVWILDNKKKRIIKIDQVSCSCKKYSFGNMLGNIEDSFETIIPEGNKLYLTPLQSDYMYCFDIPSEVFFPVKELEEITQPGYEEGKRHGRIFSFSTRKHYVFLVEVESGIWYEVYLPDLNYRKYIVKNAFEDRIKELKSSIIREDELDLQDYLLLVSEDNKTI